MSRRELSRRRLLCLLGTGPAVGSAGCLGSGGSGTPDGTRSPGPTTGTDSSTPTSTSAPTTATPPDVETPVPGECDPLGPAPSTPGPDGLEPATYPDLPNDPSAETAASFASAFERVYTTNAVVADTSTLNIPGGLDRLEFYDGSTDPRAAGTGYLVDVSFSITYEDDVSDETPLASGETPTPAPTGHTSVAATYYVTERFALRRPGHGGSWAVVACR